MSTVKKNLLYQSFYEILILILPFFTSPYISRVMGAGFLGVYSYTYSIAYYFQMFGMLGIKFYGNRSIARARDNKQELIKVFNEIFTLHILVSALSFAIYIVYSVFIAKYHYYALLQSMMVLASVFDVSWLFFGLEKFKSTVVRSTVIKLASVSCIFIFVRNDNDFPIYILIMSVSQLLNSLALFAMSFKDVEYKRTHFQALKPHLKPLLILFVPILALSLFKYMDKIMLGAIGDKVELGYYENAEKVLNVPLSIVFSFGSVMLPRTSNMVKKGDKMAVERNLTLSIKYMVGLSFAMMFGLAAISSVFAPVFWGTGFVRSGNLIMLLAVSMPFSTVASIVRNQDMIPNGRDRFYCYSIISGAIVNLVINYLLIPRYQALGVTIGTIIAEIVVCVVELWFVRKNHRYGKMLLQPMEFIVPGVIMFLIVSMIGKWMGIHIYTLIAQLIIGVLVFAAITVGIMLVFKDTYLLKELIRHKQGKHDK